MGFLARAAEATVEQAPPAELTLSGLQASVQVRFDGRVPHVFAQNDRPLRSPAQGYLTARDRLWQIVSNACSRPDLGSSRRWRLYKATTGFSSGLFETKSRWKWPTNHARSRRILAGVNISIVYQLRIAALNASFWTINWALAAS